MTVIERCGARKTVKVICLNFLPGNLKICVNEYDSQYDDRVGIYTTHCRCVRGVMQSDDK